MLQEHKLLYDVVTDLTDPMRRTYVNKPTDRVFWKDEKGRNILFSEEDVKCEIHSSVENVRYYTEIHKEETEKYFQTLKQATVQELKRTRVLREQELQALYKIASEQIKRLDDELDNPDFLRIHALWDFTQSFIVSSVIVYDENNMPGFLQSFFLQLLPQEIDSFSEVAQKEGKMDFNAFRTLCQQKGTTVLKQPDALTESPEDTSFDDKVINNMCNVLKTRTFNNQKLTKTMEARLCEEIAIKTGTTKTEICKKFGLRLTNATTALKKLRETSKYNQAKYDTLLEQIKSLP